MIRSVSVFLLRFFALGFALTQGFRLFYMVRYGDHITSTHDVLTLLIQGLRVDFAALCMLISLPTLGWIAQASVLSTPTLPRWLRVWSALALTLIVFFELPTVGFIEDYNVRPNYLFFEYLSYPQEVLAMLWGDYRVYLILSMVLIPASFMLFLHYFQHDQKPSEPTAANISHKAWQTAAFSLALVLTFFVGMRSSLQHRPLNPSLVAFSENPLLNQLVLNSAYSASYSLYSRLKYDQEYKPKFDMATEEMMRIVKPKTDVNDTDTSAPDKNIVVLLQESLGAEFVGALGGQDLTPELDHLAKEGIWFENLYATGTRSARGIEAVIGGFLPTESEAVLKRPLSQHNFFTFACLMHEQGYETVFIYGGESHFDNMKAFLLNNCFDRVVDKPQFENPVYVGSWGASDEDIYTKTHEILTQRANKPLFVFSFTISNHSPWEYPEGRITLREGEVPHTRESTVRYSDHALGGFFTRAKTTDYWNSSLFLIIADHNSRVYGETEFPVNFFHIPGLILGGGVSAQSVPHVCSQIDMVPSLLSLIGIHRYGPAPGHNVFTPEYKPRAIMQYYGTFAYLSEEHLLLIQDDASIHHYRYSPASGVEQISQTTSGVEQIQHEAIAYHLWPEYVYRNARYRLETHEKTSDTGS